MPPLDDRCYVIAEFGSSHMGCKDDALTAISTAKKCGADAAKFQLFRLSDILIDPSRGDPRTVMPPEWVPDLAATCREHHIDFLCTPFSAWAVEVLNPYVEMWKIGSFEHDRDDIWAACKSTGKPIISSTGRGRTQAFALSKWLYCVSRYPTNVSDIYLPDFYSHPEGYERWHDGFSDHTTSTVIPALAVARGARIIEKHFRLDQTPIDSPDYPHSLNPRQFAEMVDNIRLAELTCWREPPSEQPLECFPNRRET